MMRRTAAPLATQTADCIAALVAVMIHACLPPTLAPHLASASLVGILKPTGDIQPIVVG